VLQAGAALGAVRSSAGRTSEECAMLRRMLDVANAQLAAMNSETSAAVDKRIVSKLLTTYFDRCVSHIGSQCEPFKV
jgi:hypothetical protein